MTDDDWLEGGAANVISKREFCEMTGLAPKDVDRAVRDGMPVVGARPQRFRLPDAVPWLLALGRDELEAVKRRAASATARKREAEAAKIEGQVVDIELVESVIRDQVAKLQSELMALHARVPAECREVVKAEITGAINRMSFERARS
jgi:hypothetical protein